MEEKKDNLEVEDVAVADETPDTLTSEEREEFDRLKKQDEERKKKPFNIYDRVNVSTKTLDKVIIFGLIVLVGAVIIGIVAY